MQSYYKSLIINTFLDIKKLIDYIITDNVVISIDKNDYISQLYFILIETFNKIETLYYNSILLPKLHKYNYNNYNNNFNHSNINHNIKEKKPEIFYNLVLTTIVYSIIQ